MKKSHEFVVDFFTLPNWQSKYITCTSGFWKESFEFKNKKKHGVVFIRITTERLFLLFRGWMNENKPSSKTIFKSTFLKQLQDLGIEAKRSRIHRSRRDCVDIYEQIVKDSILKMYPTYEFEEFNLTD